ncbi:MAG: RagB/SusD family nutrient uptake outer membrane protein, partial [Flavobacteriaceae bacterium]|nr:RagB/SusD family nutrient uptake outer membrane protein [Flavobacteriaceae bacterium]
MKNYKFTFLIILGILFTSCSLEEEPPFLANENVYSSASNATSALFGVYEAMVQYEYYGNEFLFLTNVNSGLMVSRRTGNNNSNSYNSTLSSLKPSSGLVAIENSWTGIYQTIGRTNEVINSATASENPSTPDELIINDVIGQAYFVRAFNYFNLVRLWGEVPLRVTPTTTETVHLAKSPIEAIYAQIIIDVKRAQQLMNGAVASGTPKPQAADMLLSKVYMTLATASSAIQDSSLNYWQLAYDEAIKAYGTYDLLPSYDDLFLGTNGNNTGESIFELQSDVGASLDHTRAFTPNWYTTAATFGWFKINIENYDLHAVTYPNDPRLATTYVSTWTRGNNGSIESSYPTNTA